MKFIADYFSTARERYAIRLRRLQNFPRSEWTSDPVFREWNFCNVRREDDKTTIWFRDNIRDPLNGKIFPNHWNREAARLRLVEAVVIFRWFNRIETGERIKDLLLNGWDTEEARRRLTGVSPVVTGAYIIKGPDGYTKLEGILRCIDEARKNLPLLVPDWGTGLQVAWSQLKELYYLGGFMSYEIVSDLRHTYILSGADDIMTWANAGPGCARGLGRVQDGNVSMFNRNSKTHQATMQAMMQEIVALSRNPEYWDLDWPRWEMREAEHWSCEFDKYQRVALDGDRMKRRYHGVKE